MKMLFMLALLLPLGKGVSFLCEKLRIPAVVGLIAAGIVLGPTGFNLIRQRDYSLETIYEKYQLSHEDVSRVTYLEEVFPHQFTYEIIHFMATVGVIMLLFLAGLETDMATIRRIGNTAFFIALGGVIVPFLVGFFLSYFFDPDNLNRALIFATILTATSVSISVMSLMHYNKVQSREGATILGAAIIDDVIGIIIFSIVLGFIGGGESHLVASLGAIGLFLAGAIVAGMFVVPFVINIFAKMSTPMAVPAMALSIMFLFSALAEYVEIAGLTGAYLAGLFIGRTRHRQLVRGSIETIGHSLFIPLFFMSIGFQINLGQGSYDPVLITSFVCAGIAGKILGCGGIALLRGYTLRDAFTVGSGMIPRGEVALVIASQALRISGAIDTSGFSATVILVIVSSLLTPFFLSWGFKKGA